MSGTGPTQRSMPSPPQLPRPRRRRPWLLPTLIALGMVVIGAVALLAIGLVAGRGPSMSAAASSQQSASLGAPTPVAATSSPSASSTTSGTRPAALVAQQIDDLLQFSSNSRGTVTAAVQRVTACTEAYDDPATLRSAAEQRLTLVSRTADLSVTGLAQGAALKRELLAAWRASAQAEGHYADWAESQMGCYPAAYSTADSRAAAASSATARRHTVAFLTMWKPISAKYHLTARTVATS